ncbi:MAG: phycoerythrobilin:ferredoxin oxidoreductase, partial [Merismopedia sp. SIO2A8]|nr:phycoerythrobilin:ferredoxin oxidoreductase [Merismopedia sp. SIO2A8]
MTLYQRFLDYAIAQLDEHLDLRPYPIPEGFETKSAIVGKGKHQNEVQTDSYGACSTKLRQIRAAHVKGGSALQVLNFVIFPHLNYNLPFFGADLVTLPGGHLIAIDMQPLFRDDP